MGVQLNLTDIQSGFLSASGHTSNNTLIEQALNKALDRTDNTDNAMEVDLDMGGNSFLNVDQINGSDVSIITGDITTVADNIASINTVAGGIADVNSVAGITADVTTVAGVASDVSTVAGVVANLATVATNIANVIAVGDDIASVINVSNNLDAVNNFADLYLGERTVDPIPGGGEAFLMTLDGADANTNPADTAFGTLTITGGVSGDPDPLLVGSLYFNTTGNGGVGELRIWNGTDWVTAAFAADAANGVSYNNGTSGLIATNVQSALDEIDANVDALTASDIAYDGSSTIIDETNAQTAITALADGYLILLINASGGDVTIDDTLPVRDILVFGTAGPAVPLTVTLPTAYRAFTVTNLTTEQNDVTVKAAGQTGVVIPNNGTIVDSAYVQFDGTDYVARGTSARHIPFDNSISTISSENVQDALDEIENGLGSASSQTYTTTVVNVNTGDFVSDPWNLYLTKIGNTVIASADSIVTHATVTNRASADGEVPASFRPPNSVDNIFYTGSGRICKFRITLNGAVVLTYFDETLTLATVSNSLGVPNISYIIP